MYNENFVDKVKKFSIYRKFFIKDRGKLLENAVYNQLLFKGYKVSIGKLGQLEINFFAQKEEEMHCFQVALTLNDPKTIEREFGNLAAIKDNYSKTVITFDSFSGNTYRGINAISLEEFLLS